MKTINEALNEAYKESGGNAYFGNGFKAGVEFAQRWIPVEEELPIENNHGFSDLILTKNEFRSVKLDRYDFDYNRFIDTRYDGRATHWRPIELI